MTEEAKATQEIAKFGARGLETVDKLGSFVAKVFGTVPEDTIGVVGGDWLHQVRIRNAAKYAQRTEEILKERGISEATVPISPSVAIPILESAQDETREELVELWARLLANAMDPERQHLVRNSIVSIVKSFDPLDALILAKAMDLSSDNGLSSNVGGLYKSLEVTLDEFELSVDNLDRLGCIRKKSWTQEKVGTRLEQILFTVVGREIIRATSL